MITTNNRYEKKYDYDFIASKSASVSSKITSYYLCDTSVLLKCRRRMEVSDIFILFTQNTYHCSVFPCNEASLANTGFYFPFRFF